MTIKFCAAALLLASTRSVLADVHYADMNSTNATPPYTNWTTAATNIQDAVDAAVAGDEIVVTNGTYHPVMVNRPLYVQSVNGPQFAAINGGGSARCVYLTNKASLSGFTLTNGLAYGKGGGVCCESLTAVVSNCVIIGNEASANFVPYAQGGPIASGGGAYGGTLNNCTLTGNAAYFGVYNSSYPSAYLWVAQGGGAAYCTLNNCTLRGNSATVAGFDQINHNTAAAYGGGAYFCTLNNCTLAGNSAYAYTFNVTYVSGGAASGGTLNNCTLTGNSASSGVDSSGIGRGGADGTLNNCISFNNIPGYGDGISPGSLSGNNWFGDPLFVDTNGWTNLRLRPNSPCINAGNNSYVTNATDLDGNTRIAGRTVDIGAYEYQWPQLTIIPSGKNVVLSWPTNNAGYDYTGFILQSATNLGSPAVWSTNSLAPVVINGQNVATNPLAGPQQFFRLSN